jgi:hypothetical protein
MGEVWPNYRPNRHESIPTKTAKKPSQHTSPTTPTSDDKRTIRLLRVSKAPSSSSPEPQKLPRKKIKLSQPRKTEKKGKGEANETKKALAKKGDEGKNPKPTFHSSTKKTSKG